MVSWPYVPISSNYTSSIYGVLLPLENCLKKKKKTQFFAAKHELSPLDYGQQNSGYERVLSLLHLSINVYHTLKVELPWWLKAFWRAYSLEEGREICYINESIKWYGTIEIWSKFSGSLEDGRKFLSFRGNFPSFLPHELVSSLLWRGFVLSTSLAASRSLHSGLSPGKRSCHLSDSTYTLSSVRN